MKKFKLTSIIFVALAMAFIATVSGGASLGQKAPSLKESNEIIQLKGFLDESVEGKYDLMVEISRDEEGAEIIYQKDFLQVGVEGGFFTLPVDLKEVNLRIGEQYWLRVRGEGVPENLAELEIAPKSTIRVAESTKGGDQEARITGQYDIDWDAPTFTVRAKNTTTGYGVVAISEGGIGLGAQTTTGPAALQAVHEGGGVAIDAQGDVAVTGDLSVSGETNLINVNLPANSVASTEIEDGSIANIDIADNSITADKIADGAGSGLDADLVDGKDSSEFVTTTPSGDLTLAGNLTVNGAGPHAFTIGNVGIGTTTPLVPLHVETMGLNTGFGDNAVISLRSQGIGRTASIQLSDYNNGAAYISYLSGDLALGSSSGGIPKETLRIKGSNVGIGTSSPQTKLDMIGSSDIEGEPNVIARFRASDAGSSDAGIIIGSQNGNAPYISDAAGGGTSLGLFFRTNNAARMMIDTFGKVGIGTTSPSAELEVAASGQESAIHIDADTNQQSVLYFLKAGVDTTALYRPVNSTDLRIYASASQGDIVTFKNDGSGKVGIGTTAPEEKLHVQGIAKVKEILGLSDASLKVGSAANFSLAFTVGGVEYMRIHKDGKVGINDAAPEYPLDINGDMRVKGVLHGKTADDMYIQPYPNKALILSTDRVAISTITPEIMLAVGDKNTGIDWAGDNELRITTNGLPRIAVNANGNVGIGKTQVSGVLLDVAGDVHVDGDISADGTVQANYQDVAEWVPSFEELEAGMVVVIDQKLNNHVMPSQAAYDPKVAGVVSAQPGLLLGRGGENQYMIASTGRVKVKADASYGAIEIGDLLVTSPESGVAMKSQPMDFNGRPMHQPGTILGKALEPLSEGEDEILVLLSLQ